MLRRSIDWVGHNRISKKTERTDSLVIERIRNMKESNLVMESAIHLYANISETQRFSRP